jgi:hypothetical protein
VVALQNSKIIYSKGTRKGVFLIFKNFKEVKEVEELCDKVQDHEDRIRVLEKSEIEVATKLNITNSLLKAIAVMIGGGIVSLIFNMLYHILRRNHGKTSIHKRYKNWCYCRYD